MKKLLLAGAVALAMSSSVNANTKKEDDKWLGMFFEHYSTDHKESGAPDFLDNGNGIGGEFGFRFKPEWAARFEISSFDINSTPKDISSTRFGVDGMYFLPDDLMYVFGGLKLTKIADTDMYVDLGLGKHWHINKNFRLITEVAAYQNLGTDITHMGYKLGLAYAFGDSATSSVATAKDSDKDGINDNYDNCPNTPYGTSVDSSGCAIIAKAAVQDSDNDGVADNADKCANTPSTDIVDASGCSVFIEEEVSTNIKVMFANNSSVVSNPNDSQFQDFADFMNRFPDTSTIIEGHASANGAAAYNMMISEKRAKAVRTLLIEKYGISASRITAEGFGETQLLDTSNTAAANKVNRRITAKVTATKKEKVLK